MARILLVEDDQVTSMILARSIERAGHQVEVAKNGRQALELLESSEVELVVTDLMMPELNGEDLCERMRSDARHANVPVLLTTGMIDTDRLAWVDSYPGVEIVAKPVGLADLTGRIERLTSRKIR